MYYAVEQLVTLIIHSFRVFL